MPTAGLLPALLDLNVYSGDLLAVDLVFTDDTTGDPLNLTGFSWIAQVRASQQDGSVLETFTIDTTNAATGHILIKLLPADTLNLISTSTPGGNRVAVDYTWDLQRTKISDATDVRTVFAGTVHCYLDRTRIP